MEAKEHMNVSLFWMVQAAIIMCIGYTWLLFGLSPMSILFTAPLLILGQWHRRSWEKNSINRQIYYRQTQAQHAADEAAKIRAQYQQAQARAAAEQRARQEAQQEAYRQQQENQLREQVRQQILAETGALRQHPDEAPIAYRRGKIARPDGSGDDVVEELVLRRVAKDSEPANNPAGMKNVTPEK